MVGTVFLGFCPGPALKQQSTWPNIPLSWAWQEEPEVFVNESDRQREIKGFLLELH